MMKTSLHQRLKPKPITKDSRGVLIIPNLKVAFNRSGNIILGTIKKINKNQWIIARKGLFPKEWWILKFEIIVIDENNQTSTLRNPNSFIII